MKRYLYYPGCSLKGTAREYDESFQAIAPLLGLAVEEIKDWVCCGATVAKSISKTLSETLPEKALLHAAAAGMDLLMLCPSCHLNHFRVLQKAQKEKGPMADSSSGRPLAVKQLLEVLAFDLGWQEIKQKISRPLKGIRVLPYYGCLVIRPFGLGGRESLENPRVMEQLIKTAGGHPISFGYRMDCCGGGLLLSKEKVALKLGGSILREAKKAEPDCLLVACPLCHFMLDAKQRAIEKETGEKLGIPVLYISQLLGLALGLAPRKLGLHRLVTSPRALRVKMEKILDFTA